MIMSVLTEDHFMGHLEYLLIEQVIDLALAPKQTILWGFHCSKAIDLWGTYASVHNQTYLLGSPLSQPPSESVWPNEQVDLCVIANANQLAQENGRWLDNIWDHLKPGGLLMMHAWGGDSVIAWPELMMPRWAIEDMVNALSAHGWHQPQVMSHRIAWEIASATIASRELTLAGIAHRPDQNELSWPQTWLCDILQARVWRKSQQQLTNKTDHVVQIADIKVRH